MTSVDSFNKVLRDLKNRHAVNRESASRWLAMIISDRSIFGTDAVVNALIMLVSNLCIESRRALFEIGFSAKEIGQIKLANSDERFALIINVLREKRFLKEQ